MGEHYKQREIDSMITALLRKFPLLNGESRRKFRKLFWDRIKKLIPLKPGPPRNQATEEGLRLFQAGMPMKEIMPRVLGKQRPSDPIAASVWDGLAEMLKKNIYRAARRNNKRKRKPRRRT